METVCNFISASALCKVNLKPVSGNGLSDIVSLGCSKSPPSVGLMIGAIQEQQLSATAHYCL